MIWGHHHFRKPPSGTGERSDVATNGEATRVVVEPYEVKATRRKRWAFPSDISMNNPTMYI